MTLQKQMIKKRIIFPLHAFKLQETIKSIGIHQEINWKHPEAYKYLLEKMNIFLRQSNISF